MGRAVHIRQPWTLSPSPWSFLSWNIYIYIFNSYCNTQKSLIEKDKAIALEAER